MKKSVYVLIAVLTAAFVISAAACGSNAPANSGESSVISEPSKVVSEVSETSVVSKAEESSSITSKTYLYSSLEEYAAAPEIQSVLTSLSTDEIDCSIEIEGDNMLIMKYTYKTELDDSQLDMMGELLLEQLENYDSMFTSMKNEIETYVNIQDPHIKMAYYTMDGRLIAEYEPENY